MKQLIQRKNPIKINKTKTKKEQWTNKNQTLKKERNKSNKEYTHKKKLTTTATTTN